MMTNSKPWQTSANATHLSHDLSAENQLTAANQKHAADEAADHQAKVVTPRRYSFDDNGGGYEGL